MKISTKGRYALRLMLDLAHQDKETPVKIKDVSLRQGISVKYLEQIVAILNRAGYVKSVRGSQGGYLLTRDPKDYTVGMILRLTEGDLSPVTCLGEGENTCPRIEGCVTLRLWSELNEAIKGVIDKYTLADLMDWDKAGQ